MFGSGRHAGAVDFSRCNVLEVLVNRIECPSPQEDRVTTIRLAATSPTMYSSRNANSCALANWCAILTQCTRLSPRRAPLGQFDDIRPFHDQEVRGVLSRLQTSPDMVEALVNFQFPRIGRTIAPVARVLARSRLKLHFDGIDSVAAFQDRLSAYFGHMVNTTTDGFSYQGLQTTGSGTPTIFISNHRDIALDSAFLNYALFSEGRPTARVAIGDNLFSNDSASDFMRLNKGFVVKRNVSGRKAMYEALQNTSSFIRESVESGEQVWIAQRSGRAKDGFDRTDPALLKMLALAWREEGFQGFLDRVRLVPVSVSYELDPCDLAKARELYQVQERGEPYAKAPDEDLISMIEGVTGQKGRVQLTVGSRVSPEHGTPEGAGLAIDGQIVGNLQVFPTHQWAWNQLEAEQTGGCAGAHSDACTRPRLEELKQRCRDAPEHHRPFLLLQYANLIKNKQEIADKEA